MNYVWDELQIVIDLLEEKGKSVKSDCHYKTSLKAFKYITTKKKISLFKIYKFLAHRQIQFYKDCMV